jgi:ArsR family transcriptional regulator
VDEITTLQAEILRTLAHPRRIEILHALAAGPMEVGRIARQIGASQPNVSRHLAVLRARGSSTPNETDARSATPYQTPT